MTISQGSDQVPAMPGQRFESASEKLLRAMNAGTLVQSSGQMDRQTVSNIAKGLRRAIRRGTNSLNS